MELSPLTAIGPIDGRYRGKTAPLAPYFSELALIRYRVRVEVEYFIALCELPLPQLQGFDRALFPRLRALYEQFGPAEAQQVKDYERVTNHDVKSVEYFIKERFREWGAEAYAEFVHFGLTSQDVNNTAVPLMLLEGCREVVWPLLRQVQEAVAAMADRWREVPMLAFTHGQPASPTRLGKELGVFAYRLEEQMRAFGQIPFAAKFGGATGNFNAHCAAYPGTDWVAFGNDFVENRLGLTRAQCTTQIENYDHLAALLDAFRRTNTILLDFSKDVWQYVSMGYFKQKIKAGEVGSSAMPHKVNPIDFENAEGNLGLASALLEHLAGKLPISRLQRDLTDSTVLRNVGLPLAYQLIAYRSLLQGMGKLELHRERLDADLHANWAVVAEAIQTVLRREGYPQPYEALKALTRTNEPIDEARIRAFIDTLQVGDGVKAELRAFTPFNYVGIDTWAVRQAAGQAS
jgi:adenylosuccinate lyase